MCSNTTCTTAARSRSPSACTGSRRNSPSEAPSVLAEGHTHPFRESEGYPGFDELRPRAHAGGDGLIAVAVATRFEPGQTLQLTYAGQIREVPTINVLIQAINHRSQIATIVSQQGVTPPKVDGWAYLEAIKSA